MNARYQGAAPLLETFKRVYRKDHWPVGEATQQPGVAPKHLAQFVPDRPVAIGHSAENAEAAKETGRGESPGQLALDLWR
ncbi:MAG: hypothetical protein ACT4TC_06860 [Myxococcaceae bacterium]